MVAAIREAEAALGSSVKRVTDAEMEMFRLGRRSVVAARSMPTGHEITSEDLAIKRPGLGVPVHELHALIGRRTSHAFEVDDIIAWDNL